MYYSPHIIHQTHPPTFGDLFKLQNVLMSPSEIHLLAQGGCFTQRSLICNWVMYYDMFFVTISLSMCN